jgi:hypothetical protein
MKCSQKIATGPDMKIIMNASLFRTIAMADILYLAVAMNTMPARAQETGASDSIVALAADSQSLPQIAATAAPARGGTYWWVYPGGMAVPTPMLPLDFTAPIYSITPNEFLVDLTGGTVMVTPRQLAAEAQTANAYAAAVTAQVQGLINLITMVQTPTPLVTASSMALRASPMDGGGGGFTPDGQMQSGIPWLTIAPTNSSSFLLTVWNDQGPANYAIWWTPVLANPNYPWTAITAGTTGQTNFIVPMPQFSTGFYRAEWDTNAVPSWIAADPNNPAAGPLAVFIDSPANGAVIQ